ncbi:hypothetical protein J007_00001 [Cryptococcus neoformans]|nr:hypothetical protein J007_00001 [Cryptococcus neoformans var. grubii]
MAMYTAGKPQVHRVFFFSRQRKRHEESVGGDTERRERRLAGEAIGIPRQSDLKREMHHPCVSP